MLEFLKDYWENDRLHFHSISFILIGLLCLTLLVIASSITFNKIIEKFRNTNSKISKSYIVQFLISSNKLLLIHLYIFSIYFFINYILLNFISISNNKYSNLKTEINNINNISTSIFIAMYTMKIIDIIAVNIYKNRHKHKQYNININFITKIAKFIIFVIAFLTILGTLGINITGILAFGGIGSIAAGMAAKDLMSNFFGFLILLLDKPFKIGDHIFSPDKDIEGEVIKIGVRITKILNNDKIPIYIPNNIFSTIIVRNNTKMLNRRIVETLYIRHHQNDIEDIYSSLKIIIETHPNVDNALLLLFSISNIDLNFFKLDMKIFVNTTLLKESLEIRQDILLKMYNELIKYDSYIFDTSNLSNTVNFALENYISNTKQNNIK